MEDQKNDKRNFGDIDLVNFSNFSIFMYTNDLAYKQIPEELKHYTLAKHNEDIKNGKKPDYTPDDTNILDSCTLFKKLVKIFWGGKTEFIIVDIGSQYGSFSMELGSFIKKMKHSGKIYSFDCGMASNLCADNIKLNSLEDIIKFERKAVSNKSIPQEVFYDLGHSEDSHIVQRVNTHFSSYMIDGITLDDYFSGRNEEFIIKMDTQGAEPLVFEGMKELLLKKPTILFEFTPWTFEFTSKDPMLFLRSLPDNYVFFEFQPDNGNVYQFSREDIDKFVKAVSESTAKWTDLLIVHNQSIVYEEILSEIKKCKNYRGTKVFSIPS